MVDFPPFNQTIVASLMKRTSKFFWLLCLIIVSWSFSNSAFAGTFDGPAELPRVYVQSTMANTPAPGNTIMVAAGGSVQAAVDAAHCGDTIMLQAGSTYIGQVHLRAKPCDDNHWVIIRTSAPDSSLPPEGTRISPCYAGVASLAGRPAYPCASPKKVMATLVYNYGGSTSGPLRSDPGANHYRILGLEVTRLAGIGDITALLSTVNGGTADHIIVDRSWFHGTLHDDTSVGMALHDTTYMAAVDSYFSDFHCTSITGACSDAKTIGGGNASTPQGPYKIVDNFLEASGEGILFGGAHATTTPADIEIRRNHFFKPLQWMPGASGFVGGVSGKPFVVKNHIELKNAQRVLIEANIFENNWGGFSQTGASILLTPRNQMLKGVNVCPLCQVTDVTVRYSTISHVGSGIHMATPMDGTGYSLAGTRFSIHDVTIDDVNGAKYTGGGALLKITNNRPTNVLSNVTINHVTGFPDPTSTMLVLGDPISDPKMSGLVYTNNLMTTGQYPVWNAFPGADCALNHTPRIALPACFTSYAFSHNALIGTSVFGPSTWPTGNLFTAQVTAVQFVNFNNGNGGNYQLLSSSPFAKAGSDGKDLGADVNAIHSAIAGVY